MQQHPLELRSNAPMRGPIRKRFPTVWRLSQGWRMEPPGAGKRGRKEFELSVYIPWSAEAQLSEPVTERTYVGTLRDCVWTYLELSAAARRDALILADVDVPVAGRVTKILETAEIEWLIDRLGNEMYQPTARPRYWRVRRSEA